MFNLKSLILNLLRIGELPLGRVSIGKHCSGTPYIVARAHGADTVTIGSYCSFGPDVIIIPSMGHIPAKEYEHFRLSTFQLAGLKKGAWQEKYRLPTKGDFVKIGSDVWIGARAVILPAVTIGDGAIVGANAVVTHDVPPYAVVMGVPAKIMRFRFDEEQIQELLRIAWWNWTEERILADLDYFYGDVNAFIKKFKQ